MRRSVFVAAMFVVILGGHTSRADGPPTAAAVDVASTHFERAVRLFEEGDPKLALVEFRRSYEAVADYRTLYNIGQVLLKLGAFAEARVTLERYLVEGGDRIPTSRRESVMLNLDALKLRTAHLTFHASESGAEVTLDGVRLGATPVPRTLVSSGAHVLTVNKPGFEVLAQEFALVGGEERTVELTLVPSSLPPQSTDGPSPGAWVVWGATGLLAAGAIGTTFAWQSASADLAAAKGRVTTREELDDKKGTTETRMTIAIVLGTATLAAAAAALYLTLARKTPSPRSPSAFAPSGPLGFHGTF